MSKHTPGPWTVKRGGTTIKIGEMVYAWVNQNVGVPFFEIAANARLIATAPELLKALISAERALRQALDPEFEGALRPGGFAYDDALKTLSVARAAIAKVGKSQ